MGQGLTRYVGLAGDVQWEQGIASVWVPQHLRELTPGHISPAQKACAHRMVGTWPLTRPCCPLPISGQGRRRHGQSQGRGSAVTKVNCDAMSGGRRQLLRCLTAICGCGGASVLRCSCDNGQKALAAQHLFCEQGLQEAGCQTCCLLKHLPDGRGFSAVVCAAPLAACSMHPPGEPLGERTG